MKKYVCPELTVFENEAEDIIYTSIDANNTVVKNTDNPIYTNGSPDPNWTPWLK